jgi:antitoxin CcdA
MAADLSSSGIGARIKAARAKRGFTQRELADRLNITVGAVGQWEIGRSGPKTEHLVALSDALGVSVDWLSGGREPAGGPTDAAPEGARSSTPANIALDAGLMREARSLGIDVETALAGRLREMVADARRQHWLEENRGALDDANAFLAQHGLWSDGRRQF